MEPTTALHHGRGKGGRGGGGKEWWGEGGKDGGEMKMGGGGKTSVFPHPLRRYYIRIPEEEDIARVVVNGEIFPKRASETQLPEYYVTPNGHLFYSIFWFSACALSLLCLRRTLQVAESSIRSAKRAELVSKMASQKKEGVSSNR